MRNLYIVITTSLFVFCCQLNVLAQFTMPGSGSNSITACSGTLYDSGGSNGNYPNNANQTLTICSGSSNAVSVVFNSYNLENNADFITIYDGLTATGIPLASLTGVGTNFQVVSTSNCITIVFTSDAATVASGFSGTISCILPCQNFTSSVASTTPGIVNGNEIEICEDETVTLNATANFPNNNVNYNQTVANTQFQWIYSDASVQTGSTITRTFNDYGIYKVMLLATDVNGCHQTGAVTELYIKVAGKPKFVGTQALDNSVCVNEPFGLKGENQQVTSSYVCQSPPPGTTFLPDGSGASYNTSILVNCFVAGQTLTSASDLTSVCINMEHSYLGDLNMTITCPSGQSVVLKPYPGGAGTYLGSPLDYTGSNGMPGTGSTYCFSMAATWPTMLAANTAGGMYHVQAGNPQNNSMAPGTYQPHQSFAGLVGCPLNGNWTINVTDNLLSDDGYIFDWGLDFNPSLYNSPIADFTPVTTSETWTGNVIVSQSNGDAVAVSSTVGQQCYTYTVTNNYNCTYDTTVCVNVRPLPNAGVDTTVSMCDDASVINLWNYLSGTQNISNNATWSGPSTLTGGHLGTFNPGVNVTGTYLVSILSQYGCGPDTAYVTVNLGDNPVVAYTGPQQVCGNDVPLSANATVTAPSSIATYNWYVNNTLVGSGSPFIYESVLTPTAPLNGYVIAVSSLGCKDTVNFYSLMFADPVSNFDLSDNCAGLVMQTTNSSQYDGTPSSGSSLNYNWNFGDGNTSTQQSPVHTYAQGGTYTVTLITGSSETQLCKDTLEKQIIVTEPIVANFGADVSCFQKVTFYSLAQVSVGDTISTYTWDLSEGAPQNDSTFTYQYQNNGIYDVTLTIENKDGCTYTSTQQIDVQESAQLSTIQFPNIITPNGDGVNDVFFIDPIYDECYFYTYKLYNRWGTLVFTTEVSSKSFTGKADVGGKLNDGVYFWVLVGREKFSNSGEEVKKNGTLTVVTGGTQ